MLFRKNKKNKYIIDYTKFSGEKEISSNNVSIDVSLKNSCVELFWIAQLKYLNNYGFVGSSSQYFDAFNYTDSYIYDENNNYKGKNNVITTEILFDSNNRLEKKDSSYYIGYKPIKIIQNLLIKVLMFTLLLLILKNFNHLDYVIWVV